MANTFDGDSLRKRLDAIILLLMENSADGAETVTRKVERLLDLGLEKPEVAEIIGKSVSYVSAIVAKKRKGGSK